MGTSSIDSELPVLTSRKHPRTSSQTPAMIIVSPELPPIRCTVIDISVSGAGLSLWVGSTFGIPNSFDLLIEGDSTKHACRVAWMQPHKLGVEFK